MAVYSKYGAPKDVFFSFPVVCKNGEWKIVANLALSEFSKKRIVATGNELLEEKSMAFKK
jgi:malate/lactate dehydrogenase